MASLSEQTTFLTPTTCFAIACTAFSLVAISVVWQQSRISTTRPVPEETRPRSRRRRAVDSVYISEDEDNGKSAQISDLISLVSSVSYELSSSSSPDLLTELSLLVAVLCRLQQEVSVKPEFISNTVGLVTCFDAAIDSLRESLVIARNSLENGEYRSADAQRTSLRLKAQRPVLEFLLSSLHSPGSSLMTRTVSESSSVGLLPSPDFDEHIGITPGVDEKCFIDPPPQYSPPITSRTFSDHKSQLEEKSMSPAQEIMPFDADRIFAAVNANDSDALVELLSLGADPSIPFGDLQRTPLHIAAHLNHVQCLAILLKNEAEISTQDAKGDTALHLSAWSGHVEALSLLLTHSAEVDYLSGRDGYSPLWCAISAQHIDAARLLLKHGARVSLRSASEGGLTPLHQAAVTSQSAMCELLLERGAAVSALDDDKNTALHYAAASGSVASVKILLKGGADIEAMNGYGLRAVHWAAHKNHTEVILTLLKHGAGLDGRANEGATPLHLAANRGHVMAAKLLLERGANRRPGSATWDGVSGTPAEMAKAKGHTRLVRILRA